MPETIDFSSILLRPPTIPSGIETSFRRITTRTTTWRPRVRGSCGWSIGRAVRTRGAWWTTRDQNRA